MSLEMAALVPSGTDDDAKESLLSMLTFARPDGSKAEIEFIRTFIEPLGAEPDEFGNYVLRIGDAPVLWSCHTDTVHRAAGRQHIVESDKGIVTLAPDSKFSCLGADDTAGVWLASEMIIAQVPGLYIFHRAEEVGGLGSSHIAKKTPELLNGIKFAIALDRMGYTNVITHQGGERCCSQAFALSLAEQLGMGYEPDDTGLFTDTANYTDLIGECTNLSVGYDRAHTAKEQLDIRFLFELRYALLGLDIDTLVCERKPGEIDLWADYGVPTSYKNHYRYDKNDEPFDVDWEPVGPTSLERLIADHPDVAADLMEQWGINEIDMREAIVAAGRRI